MEPKSNETQGGSILASDAEVILDSLRPFSTYLFSVKAMNYDMSGEYEEMEANTTRAGNIQVVHFTWEHGGKLTNNNVLSISYKVGYNRPHNSHKIARTMTTALGY